MKDRPLFAWAGLWRSSDEWGPVYSGVMTNANSAVAPVHNRMPVLILPDEYETWLHGSFDDAFAFQERVFPPELIDVTRTTDLWSRTSRAAKAQATLTP